LKTFIVGSLAGLGLLFLTASCSEERVGPVKKSTTPPPPVSNVQVEGLPGGAKITYDLPDATDISYVKGEYLFHGEKRTVRSSVYHNYLTVEGLGSVEPLEITLYLVDHSENLSEPVIKTFTPERPPIETIFSSLKVIEDFGGVRLYWENELGVEIGITCFAADSLGELQEVDLMYTALKEGYYAVRGFNTDERLFAFSIVDKWGNLSDTLRGVFRPLFEKLLDKSKHFEFFRPYDNTTVRTSRPLRYTWDGSLATAQVWHTEEGTTYTMPETFTFGLGTEAKLSRFTIWQRQSDSPFSGNFIQLFEVWGAKECRLDVPNSYWLEDWKADWELLGDCEIIKPSGLPINESSADDVAARAAGIDFDFPIEAEKVQYLRFAVKKTWTNGNTLCIAEFSFYGDDGSGE
jgi:hypothetical protein